MRPPTKAAGSAMAPFSWSRRICRSAPRCSSRAEALYAAPGPPRVRDFCPPPREAASGGAAAAAAATRRARRRWTLEHDCALAAGLDAWDAAGAARLDVAVRRLWRAAHATAGGLAHAGAAAGAVPCGGAQGACRSAGCIRGAAAQRAVLAPAGRASRGWARGGGWRVRRRGAAPGRRAVARAAALCRPPHGRLRAVVRGVAADVAHALHLGAPRCGAAAAAGCARQRGHAHCEHAAADGL
jgi:hypothetical protein